MHMKATWNGAVIAEAEQSELIRIEGNWYFPPTHVNKDYCVASDTHTECPWKGTASYFTLEVDGQHNEDAAWYYPTPKPSAITTVGKDFSGYVAFWRGVVVEQ